MAERDLIAVSPEKLEKISGFTRVQRHTAKFPRRAVPAAEARKLQRRQLEALVPEAVPDQPRERPIKAVRPTTAEVAKLRAIHESEAATAELVAQKLNADQVLGLAYSSLALLEYSKLRSEYERRRRQARDSRRVEAQWRKVVEAASQAFASAGLRGMAETDLDRLATELTRNKANLNAVLDIANSAHDVETITAGGPRPAGNFVTVVGKFVDLPPVVVPVPPNLCEKPVEGKYTKHFSYSFSLTVKLTVWCPTWTNPFRTCKKSFTLAGVSFSLGLEVGYRITCCGATAWGQAYAQACGTIIGITVCASCSAKVTGVAGITKSGSGSTCTYGLGVVAELKCTFAGVTVFYASVPYGWTITGPCPPPNLPC
jgi:hypothetical protein